MRAVVFGNGAARKETRLSSRGASASTDGPDTAGWGNLLEVGAFFGEGEGGESEKNGGDSDLHVGTIE